MDYIQEISEAWIKEELYELDYLIEDISDRDDFMNILKKVGEVLKDDEFFQYLYGEYLQCGDTHYFETRIRENLFSINYDSRLIVIPVSGKVSDINSFDINQFYPLFTSTGVINQYSSIMLYSHIIPVPKDLIPFRNVETLLTNFNFDFIHRDIDSQLTDTLENGGDIIDINKDYLIKPINQINQKKFDDLCKPFFVDNFTSDKHESGLIVGVFSRINTEDTEDELQHTKKLFNACKKLHPHLTFGRIKLYSDFISE